jgi:uncharacterized SAM-binding protein YcdF (DUF218 family)
MAHVSQQGSLQHTITRVMVVVMVIATVVFGVKLCLPGLGQWLLSASDPSQADAIVVLGGGRERLGMAVRLYEQRLAPEIWYTGNYTPTGQIILNEPQLALRAAIEMGIPANDVHLLTTTSTWEDGQQIAAYAQARGVKSILLVTSWYHGRRGVCVVRHHLAGTGIQLSFQAASNATFGPDNWWRNEEGLMDVISEYIKFAFYWVHYGLAPWQC